MNRKRLWIVLALALTSGLAAAYISVDYLRSQAGPVIPVGPKKAQMAVAVHDLPLGAIVNLEDVRLIDYPSNALPDGYLSSVDEVVGRGVIQNMKANEPFLNSKLADKDNGGLQITIPEGMRAVSVRVNDVVTVAGFVVPGTRVDVLLTIQPPGNSTAGKLTKIILPDMLVLAANQQATKDPEGKPLTYTVATLLVTPEQAEKLTLAANEGQIQLALRNTLDGDSVSTPGVQVAQLLGARPLARTGGSRRVVRADTTNRPATVEVFKGGVKTIQKF